jgi:hypothetical protein
MFLEEESLEELDPKYCNVLCNFPLAFHDLHELQRQDVELGKIIQSLEKGDKVPGYQLGKEVLYYTHKKGQDRKIVVQTAAVPMVFDFFHSPMGGHLGVFKTLQKICECFTWKGMVKEIKRRVSCCRDCGRSKPA